MIREVQSLRVLYNGREVGILSEVEGEIAFQYTERWVKSGFSLSPFSLPLSREIFISKKPVFQGLYGVFHDSLPDGWGELLISRMLAKQGVNYAGLSPLTKLALVSAGGLGGLTYHPSQADDSPVDYRLDELAAQAAGILDDGGADADLDKIFRLGGSSGGARPKAHIADGGDEWIVKFPCRIDPPDAGLSEFEANRAAERCGIAVNEYRLFPSSLCSGYFGAKRFDRTPDGRVHTVSLSALLETTHRLPNLDYMHLFQVISSISVRRGADLREAYRRMCFNVLYGNKDDHGKNFAFLYDERLRGYVLSPAFDLTATPHKAEHEMTVLGQGNPTERDLRAIARELKLPEAFCSAALQKFRAVLGLR